MTRIGFTILYEAIHHLSHKGFADFMAKNFDYWIVIEGLAGSSGSTSWCKNLALSSRSLDGSHQFMEGFSKEHPHVIYYSPGKKWINKDEMVNEAVKVVQMITDECFLWQVDADEIWDAESLKAAERELLFSEHKAGAFQFNHYLCKDALGRQLIGRGQWGNGYNIRLWKWKGEKFVSHEPPRLQGQLASESLGQKYEHYSYYFEKDVLFKSQYYQGHESILKGWKELKRYTGPLPVPITMLFGRNSRKFHPKLSFIDELKIEIPCAALSPNLV